jgi:hypothetical protein
MTVIDSGSFELDARTYTVADITRDLISYDVSEYLPGNDFLADYTIVFEVPIPVESTGDCFIKYEFPSELGLTDWTGAIVSSTGMFVDSEGNSKLGFEDSGENWVAIKGCEFAPSLDYNISTSNDFSQNVFSVTFYNISNPNLIDLNPISIKLFKQWNITDDTGPGIIA